MEDATAREIANKSTAALTVLAINGMAVQGMGLVWVAPGFALCIATIARLYVKVRQEEKRGRFLTQDDVDAIKEHAREVQEHLNCVMARKETAKNTTLFKLCTEMNNSLRILWVQLNSPKVLKMRLKDHDSLLRQLDDNVRRLAGG